MLVLLAIFGLIYGNSEVARREILHQLYSFLDRSSAKAVEDIATSAGKPAASLVATVIGIAVALFGASGVFGQLQDALNTIWGGQTQAGQKFRQLPARALLILRYGRRGVLFASSFAYSLRRYHRFRWLP